MSKNTDKWNSILESIGVTESNNQTFPSFFPNVINAMSKSIGFDLVSVRPIGYNKIYRKSKIKKILLKI